MYQSERVLKLWQKGHLQVAADGNGSEFLAMFNPSTGNSSTKAHAFSSKWSERTAKYVALILELSDDRFRRIVVDAHEMMVTNHSAEVNTPIGSLAQDSDDNFDLELDE